MTKLRFCPKCGTKIESGESFCGECGFNMENSEAFQEPTHEQDRGAEPVGATVNAQAEVPYGSQQFTAAQKETVPKSSRMPIIIISIVLGSIILIGGTAFWWFSQGRNIVGKTGSAVQNGTQVVTLELPAYSLNEGSYTSEQKVEIIKPAGEAVEAYYTIDGTDPTAKSTKYQNPVVLQSNTTLKSIAIDKNGNQSGIKTATYAIAIPQQGTTQPQTTQPTTTTPAASTNATERAQFESNIAGTWKVRDSSGFVLYYTFSGGRVNVTDGGSDYFDDVYSFNISPGNNGTIGTVDAGTHSFSIDCNPLGDNAIFINGMYASYN